MTGKLCLLSLPLLFIVLNPIVKQGEIFAAHGTQLFHDAHRLYDGGTKGSLQVRHRVISFAGHDWIVSQSGNGRRTPGPNYFSNSKENVWVDARGRLHLRILYTDGRWECAEVTLVGSRSFGEYLFRVSTDGDKLDKNIVAGLFLYRDDFNEIDIEFSRWGEEMETAGNYVVQPSDQEGNMYRFSLEEAGKRSTHIINWQRDSINFKSYRGHRKSQPNRLLINEWLYQGENIPIGSEVEVLINLWLFMGNPPADNQEAELIIEGFQIR